MIEEGGLAGAVRADDCPQLPFSTLNDTSRTATRLPNCRDAFDPQHAHESLLRRMKPGTRKSSTIATNSMPTKDIQLTVRLEDSPAVRRDRS